MSHVEIGSPEWCDAAERSEWEFMADVIREARGKVTPHPSYWGPAQRMAEARSIEGWRAKHPAQVPQENMRIIARVPQPPIYSLFEDASGDNSPIYTWRQGATAQHLRIIADRFFVHVTQRDAPAAKICMSVDSGNSWFDLPGDHFHHFRDAPPITASGRRPYDVHSAAAASAVEVLKALPEDREAFDRGDLSVTFVVQYRTDEHRSLWRDHEGGDHVGRFAHKNTARQSAAFSEMSRKHGRANVRVVRRFVVDEDVTPA